MTTKRFLGLLFSLCVLFDARMALADTPLTLQPAGTEKLTMAPDAARAAGHRAAESFDKGDFAGAIADYEQLVNGGIVNGQLYYNLGMAYYRAGRKGDAMAAFLAARRFLPRDPDTAANLRFVLNNVHDKLEAEVPPDTLSRIGFWVHSFTLKELGWIAAVFSGLWGLGLTVSLLVPRAKSFRWPIFMGGLLPLVLALSLVLKSEEQQAWGAVAQAEAKVYSGPGILNAVVFELHEGAPVLVTEAAAGGYYRIQLSDGKKGWISDREVKVFGPL